MKNLAEKPGLVALFLLQLICVTYLLIDALIDVSGLEELAGIRENHLLEYLVVMALVFSLVATGFQIYQLLMRNRNIENQLKAASGRFAELLEQHFRDWRLTSSERDVALLAIKGLGIADVAELRNTKEGTVKAQLNSIYRKAGVTGRPQLISMFVEELMGNVLERNDAA